MMMLSGILRKPLVQFLVFALLTAGIFCVIFSAVDLTAVLGILTHAHLGSLFIAFLIMFTYPTSIAWRWKYLLGSMGYVVSFRECLKIVLGTWPIMSVTPLKAGDMLKGYYLGQKVPVWVSTGSVITEKILDVYSLLAFSIIGSIFLGLKDIMLLSCGLLIVSSVAILITMRGGALLPPRFESKIAALTHSIQTLTSQPGKLLFILGFSIVKWLLAILQVHLCFQACGADVPLTFTSAAFPISVFVGLIPISLAGMGTREAALIYLFRDYADPAICVSVGLLYAIFGYWLLTILSLPTMRGLMRTTAAD
jgi:uncharacterized membrane protein YbhN (UPF0104 family)